MRTVSRRFLSVVLCSGVLLGVPYGARAENHSRTKSFVTDVSLDAGRLRQVRAGNLSVSGPRVLRRTPAGDYQVRAGSRPAIRITEGPAGRHRIKQSGIYTLIGGTVFAPAPGNTVIRKVRTNSPDTDLSGPRVAWTDAPGRVLYRDLSQDTGVFVMTQDAAGPVAIWADRVAWLDRAGSIRVRDVFGRTPRIIPAGRKAKDLRLNHSTLSWTTRDGSIRLVNLARRGTRSYSSPVRPPYSVDGARIAGVVEGRVRVRPLPFDVR